MELVKIALRIDPTSLAALEKIAATESDSIEGLVRDAVRRDLYRRSRAKKAVRADERLVAPLRALLADDFAYASNWQALQERLHSKGYGLRESGAGLALVRIPSGERVAKASDLGYSYSRLMRRFNAPFPGHSHRYLFHAMR